MQLPTVADKCRTQRITADVLHMDCVCIAHVLGMYCECITNPIRNQNFVQFKNLGAEETPSVDALRTCAEVGRLISA